MNTQYVLLLLAVCICFALSSIQTRVLMGCGTDHPVHLFLANCIRENRHRLFVRVPRLINESYCSAFPLFLHWHLSFLNEKQINSISRLLNPLVNCALIIITFFTAARHGQNTAAIAGWVSLALALTPQYYYAYSARNYGLSARPVGLLLFTLICVNIVGHISISQDGYKIALLITTGYLIWGFNTFAQQSLLFISLAIGLCFKDWQMLYLAIGSLLLFMIINRAYAINYLKYTLKFMKAYSSDLAAVFIKKHRYSIWRDLIWDIWVRIRQNPQSGMVYAYQNSVMIVTFLNPLVIVSMSSLVLHRLEIPGMQEWGKLVTGGFLIFLLTTFRATRFLGEPERYVEMVTPTATLVGVFVLYQLFGTTGILIVLLYCALVNVGQIVLAKELTARVKGMPAELSQIRQVIETEFGSESVRFSSNDEQVTKYLMTSSWDFARIWSSDQRFGGFRVFDAISEFPFIRKEPFETALRDYRINACVLHKTNFDEIFYDSKDSRRLKLLSDSKQYRVYRIHW